MFENLTPLIGHNKQQADIISLINQNKLPHAILLHGAKGIGKAKFANYLALMTICGNNPVQNKTKFSINTNSAQFKRIQAGSLDEFKLVQPLDGKKQINVEQVRSSISNLNLVSDTKRIIIIDTIDDLNPNSANALLKTLEEPPANTMLVLISSNPSKLLPTIVSRCRKVKLDNLSVSHIEQILDQENIKGSNVDQALEFSNGTVANVLDFLTDGKIILDHLNDFFALKQIHAVDVINISEKLADKKLKESLVYSQLQNMLYNASKLSLGLESALNNVECVKAMSSNYSDVKLQEAYDKLLEAKKMRDGINIGQAQSLESVFSLFI